MKFRIRSKIIVPVIILLMTLFATTFLLTKNVLEETLIKEFTSKGLALTKILASTAQDTILNRDASTIQGFIDEYREIKGVGYIYIVDENSVVIAHTFTPYVPKYIKENIKKRGITDKIKIENINVRNEDIIQIRAPLLAGLLGDVYLGMEIGKEKRKIQETLIARVLSINGLLFILGIFIISLLILKVINPIVDLTRIIREIDRTKKFNIDEINVDPKDEIGELTASFSNMFENLKGYTEKLEEIVEERAKIIETQQKEIAESSRLSALGEIASGIAHEINNPLAIIGGNALLIKRQAKAGTIETKDLLKKVQVIEETITRVTKIIEGLKNISRNSGGKHKWCLVSDIMSDLIGILEEHIRLKSIELALDTNLDEMKYELKCDRVQISQVLLNLINNAVDALEGIDHPKIIIDFKLIKNSFEISVQDNGEGIPSEVKDKIFNPFFTSKEVGKGTGIGLSISSNIMKSHDGRIMLSDLGEGTCFILKFPLSRIKT
jgi:signal transduction histidine kinase